jgi:hypothetical protein
VAPVDPVAPIGPVGPVTPVAPVAFEPHGESGFGKHISRGGITDSGLGDFEIIFFIEEHSESFFNLFS